MQLPSELQTVIRDLAHAIDALGPILRKLGEVPEPEIRYLFREEVADRLGVAPEEVSKMVGEGCPAYKVGKGYRFLWSEVQMFLHMNRRTGARRDTWTGAVPKRRAS